MAKFYGKIGFIKSADETRPGYWSEEYEEREYCGDIANDYRQVQTSTETTNNDLSVNASLSVIADPYLTENFFAIRYVLWHNVKWRVSKVDAGSPPRLKITLGGIYNVQ